mmetsp:Transcript_30083/g.94867  ORF Transcript_30083/g.94867 Transcript_30083/m.94867 type:complete len:469 (+) Transcript_30083:69-1475(+)
MREELAALLWALCILAMRFARPRLTDCCPRCVSIVVMHWPEGYLLGLAALQLPNELKGVLLWYGWPAGFHLVSHFAAWVSTIMAVRHLFQLRPHRALCPQSADLVADLVLLPPTLGLLALRCLQLLSERQDPWRAATAVSAAELWEAWALWSFQRLSMRPSAAGAASPLDAEGLCSAGLRQYLLLVSGVNAVEVLVRVAAQVQPQTCDLLWGTETTCQQVLLRLHDQTVGALWCSSLVALYCLTRFEAASLPGHLRFHRPRLKFLGAQTVIVVASVQRLVLAAGVTVNLWQEAASWSAHVFLLCLESCALAALHIQAYPGDKLLEDDARALAKPASARSVAPCATAYGKLREEAAEDAGAQRPKPILPLPKAGAPSQGPRVAVPRLPLPLPRDPNEGAMPHYSGTPSPSSSLTMDWTSRSSSGSSRTVKPESNRTCPGEGGCEPAPVARAGSSHPAGQCGDVRAADSA